MPVGFSLENSLEDRNKRFLYVCPNLAAAAKALKEAGDGALDHLKFKWNATWDMIQAHDPECTLLYIPELVAPPFESLILLEELLNANVQLLDDLAKLDDPMFCRHAPKRTVYLWCASTCSPIDNLLEDKAWVAYSDIESQTEMMRIQSGLLSLEDCMTGLLIMSKKLEQTLLQPEPQHESESAREPEIVLIVGELPRECKHILDSMELLFDADRVASVITCDASVCFMEGITPELISLLNIADELDKFGIDVMFREIKRRLPQWHTFVFIGKWSFGSAKAKAHFIQQEKELPTAACVYDFPSWWSLHSCKPDPIRVRFVFNPAIAFRHFLSGEGSKLKIKFGVDEDDCDERD